MSLNAYSITRYSRPAARRGLTLVLDEGRLEAEREAAGRREIAARAAAAGITAGEYLSRRGAVRRAKSKARQLGLAYWPALLADGCDPQAFVAAERVLMRTSGGTWGEFEVTSKHDRIWGDTCPRVEMHHGGWDRCGHHGRSPEQVRAMWLAAGCRDTQKFRAQVATGVLAKPGDTAPWLRAYIRGSRWLERNQARGGRLYISRKAVAALGRLTPELRIAALRKFADGLVNAPTRATADGPQLLPLRIRDLDWPEVARVQALLKSGNVRARAALAGEKRAALLLGLGTWCMGLAIRPDGHGVTLCDIAAELAPSFDMLPLAFARRIALGEKPVDIAQGLLTRAEAHAWLISDYAIPSFATDGPHDDLAVVGSIATWLSVRLSDQTGWAFTHRSIRVLRWLERLHQIGRWPALFELREARVPGQEEPRKWMAADVLDEIQADDIYTGRDRLDDVLERSARRLGESWLTSAAQDHRDLTRPPAWAKSLPRGIRLLNTAAELIAEGRTMKHCVGGYAEAVRAGQCFILAIDLPRHGRSTVELSPGNLAVLQHKGERNDAPPSRNMWLLQAWLKVRHDRRVAAKMAAPRQVRMNFGQRMDAATAAFGSLAQQARAFEFEIDAQNADQYLGSPPCPGWTLPANVTLQGHVTPVEPVRPDVALAAYLDQRARHQFLVGQGPLPDGTANGGCSVSGTSEEG